MNDLRQLHPKLKYRLSPAFLKALIAWWIFVFMTLGHAGATTVTTNAATSVTAGSATLNGNLVLTAPSATVWFQYGGAGKGYLYKTDNQTRTVGGAFSATVTGYPLIAGGTYQVQAAFDDGNGTTTGNTITMTLPYVSPNTQYSGQFDTYSSQLVQTKFNITQMVSIVPQPYVDRMSDLFWGVMFGMIFVMMWLRQEDVTVPSLVGFLIGGSLWSMMPAEYVSMAYSLTIVSFAGIMYGLIKSKI